jgi:hypothetical protein
MKNHQKTLSNVQIKRAQKNSFIHKKHTNINSYTDGDSYSGTDMSEIFYTECCAQLTDGSLTHSEDDNAQCCLNSDSHSISHQPPQTM